MGRSMGGRLLKCQTPTRLWWPKALEGGRGAGFFEGGLAALRRGCFGGRWYLCLICAHEPLVLSPHATQKQLHVPLPSIFLGKRPSTKKSKNH